MDWISDFCSWRLLGAILYFFFIPESSRFKIGGTVIFEIAATGTSVTQEKRMVLSVSATNSMTAALMADFIVVIAQKILNKVESEI